MPVDEEPVADGTLVLYPDNGATIAIPFNAAVHGPEVRRYRSHFSTCSEAAKFRKPRGTGK